MGGTKLYTSVKELMCDDIVKLDFVLSFALLHSNSIY